jgi:hypothetical protein
MFADYRVPQALLGLGVISYSKKLFDTLILHQEYHNQKAIGHDNDAHMIKRGHVYEVEIRGASILVVELLVEKIKEIMDSDRDRYSKQIPYINSIVLDFFLWDYAKENSDALASFPIHRTRSIYY